MTNEELEEKLFHLGAAPACATILVTPANHYAGVYDDGNDGLPWRPPTDFETATEMLERVVPKLSKIQVEVTIYKSLIGGEELWSATLAVYTQASLEDRPSRWNYCETLRAFAATPALALSLAVLKALEKMKGTKGE